MQSDGAQTASDPSWVVPSPRPPRALQAGEVGVVEQAEPKAGAKAHKLVSRVSQLFDLVPNWPGVDLDVLEDAARSQVEDGAQSGADLVDMVSTHDVSCWVTATAGTAIGFGIARRAGDAGQRHRRRHHRRGSRAVLKLHVAGAVGVSSVSRDISRSRAGTARRPNPFRPRHLCGGRCPPCKKPVAR